MSYNIKELPKYINTAGKITVVTSLLGVVIFAAAFLLNIGAKELVKVDAQGFATTTVTVLNTPPEWTVDAQEENESSTTTPTNSDYQVAWVATATDSNDEDYFLLICNTAIAPSSTSNGPPTCNSPIQWAVSATTTSGSEARAATTTTEAPAVFAESNDWYAWICDAIVTNPRCNVLSKQGTATTASPFNVNHRPTFTVYSDNSETLGSAPGDVVTFYATTTDTDVVDAADTKQLIVCSTAAYSTTTNTCDATTLATSSFSTATQLTATYTISIPTRDTTYGAYGFVIDEHGHEATTTQQGANTVLTVANVAPTILGGNIILNGGNPITLTQEAAETTGFTLDFTASDNNSCSTSAQTAEITSYDLAVYRSGVSTSTCDTTGTNYNANECYDSGVATTTWNLVCTASSTSCTYDGLGDDDLDMLFECTFPLWYVADPTSGTSTQTFYFDENWRASVSPVDDDGASSTLVEADTPVELNSFMMFALDTTDIPYGDLEPGQRTDPLAATTTLRATGNVGLDQLLSGEHMCDYYTTAVKCQTSATSTISDQFQVFGTSTISYGAATSSGYILSSSTPVNIELNVLKPTSTATQTTGITYWGIEVPDTITKAGAYTGENTIWGVSGEPTEWY